MTDAKTGFAAYLKTDAHKIPVFASKRHCYFKTLRQAQRKLERIRTAGFGHVYDRATGELVWTIAL